MSRICIICITIFHNHENLKFVFLHEFGIIFISGCSIQQASLKMAMNFREREKGHLHIAPVSGEIVNAFTLCTRCTLWVQNLHGYRHICIGFGTECIQWACSWLWCKFIIRVVLAWHHHLDSTSRYLYVALLLLLVVQMGISSARMGIRSKQHKMNNMERECK